MNKTVLLCTFTTSQSLRDCIGYIRVFYKETVLDLETYQYTHQPESLICVYNVIAPSKRIEDTISINKKKQTTTFYTINALNSLIKSLNNGILDKEFRINWNDYQNTLILSDKQDNRRLIPIEKVNSI